MTGTNHTATGGMIGLAIGNPIALPVAYAAHFVLDALPHFDKHPSWAKRRNFWLFVSFDGSLALTVLLSLWFLTNGSWLVIGSAILCAFPDTMHAIDLIGKHYKKSFSIAKYDPTYNFHSRIQTMVSPQGAYAELAWFGLMVLSIIQLA